MFPAFSGGFLIHCATREVLSLFFSVQSQYNILAYLLEMPGTYFLPISVPHANSVFSQLISSYDQQDRKRSDGLGFNRATLLLPAVDIHLLDKRSSDKKLLYYCYYYFYISALGSWVGSLSRSRVSLQYFYVIYQKLMLSYSTVSQAALAPDLDTLPEQHSILPRLQSRASLLPPT